MEEKLLGAELTSKYSFCFIVMEDLMSGKQVVRPLRCNSHTRFILGELGFVNIWKTNSTNSRSDLFPIVRNINEEFFQGVIQSKLLSLTCWIL